ncbi:MAG: hypothetical protein WCL16_09515 [bacterium]
MPVKQFKEHADFLKNVMNILILVSGALGSVVNLIKGNNVPMIISMVAVAVVIGFVLVEWKSRRDQAVVARAAVAEAAQNAVPTRRPLAPDSEPVPHPIVIPHEPVAGGDRVYTDSLGKRVLRLVVARGRNEVHE